MEGQRSDHFDVQKHELRKITLAAVTALGATVRIMPKPNGPTAQA